jgi:hypothetical protein
MAREKTFVISLGFIGQSPVSREAGQSVRDPELDALRIEPGAPGAETPRCKATFARGPRPSGPTPRACRPLCAPHDAQNRESLDGYSSPHHASPRWQQPSGSLFGWSFRPPRHQRGSTENRGSRRRCRCIAAPDLNPLAPGTSSASFLRRPDRRARLRVLRITSPCYRGTNGPAQHVFAAGG